MRKKFFLTLLSVLMVFCCALAFVACGEKEHTTHIDADNDGYCDECKEKMPTQQGGDDDGPGGGGDDGGDDGHVHTYSEEWTTDGTYHWHEATCGCKDIYGKLLIKDRSEHSFARDYAFKQAGTKVTERSSYEDVLTCPVCKYERDMDEGYEMYLSGSVASMPNLKPINVNTANNKVTIKLGGQDITQDRTVIKTTLEKLVYDEDTETFSYAGEDGRGVLLDVGDSISFYNYNGSVVKNRDKEGKVILYTYGNFRSFGSPALTKKGYYKLTWSPTAEDDQEYGNLTAERLYNHDHKFAGNDVATADNYGYDQTSHWKVCTEMENNGLDPKDPLYQEWPCDGVECNEEGVLIKEDHDCNAQGKCKCGFVDPEKCTHQNLTFVGSPRYPTAQILQTETNYGYISTLMHDGGLYQYCLDCGSEFFYRVEDTMLNNIWEDLHKEDPKAFNTVWVRTKMVGEGEEKTKVAWEEEDILARTYAYDIDEDGNQRNIAYVDNLYFKGSKDDPYKYDANGDYTTHYTLSGSLISQAIIIQKPGVYTVDVVPLFPKDGRELRLRTFGAAPFYPVSNLGGGVGTGQPPLNQRYEYTFADDGKTPVKGGLVDVPYVIEEGKWRTEITEEEATRKASATANPLKDIMGYKDWRAKITVNGTPGTASGNLLATDVQQLTFCVTQDDLDKCKPYVPTDIPGARPTLIVRFCLGWYAQNNDTKAWEKSSINTRSLLGITYSESCAEHEYGAYYANSNAKQLPYNNASVNEPTLFDNYEYCKNCGYGRVKDQVYAWRNNKSDSLGSARFYITYKPEYEGKKFNVGGSDIGLQIKITQPGTYTINYNAYCYQNQGAGLDPSSNTNITGVDHPQAGVAYNYLSQITIGGDPIAADRNWGDLNYNGKQDADEKKAETGKYVGGMVTVFKTSNSGGSWTAAGSLKDGTTATILSSNYKYHVLTTFRNMFTINGVKATQAGGGEADFKSFDGNKMPVNVKSISFTITADMLKEDKLEKTDVHYMSDYGADSTPGVIIAIRSVPTFSSKATGVSGSGLFFTLSKTN